MLEFDLQKMARHLTDVLDRDREVITGGDPPELAFKAVQYGEANAILTWPLLTVIPINKTRELHTTRKYRVDFEIHMIIYHGQVDTMSAIQEGAHSRAESVERYLHTDMKWNFVDKEDETKDKVIWGYVETLDHPVVFLGENNLWSASRLQLTAQSQEVFTP